MMHKEMLAPGGDWEKASPRNAQQQRPIPGLPGLEASPEGCSSPVNGGSTLRWVLEQTLGPAGLSEGWSFIWPRCTCVGESVGCRRF